MLYLKIWKMTFKKSFFARIMSILLIAGFLPMLNSLSNIESIEIRDPYFHVLIQTSENFGSIVDRLQELPGIKKVQSISSQALKANLKKTVGEEAESLLNELDFEYSGLKVSISSELRLKAQELLQTYIEKIAGDNVEVGPTIYPNNNKSNIKFSFLMNPYFQFGIIGLAWLAFSIYFKRNEKSIFYLFNQFNRKNSAQLGIYFLNFIMTFAIFLFIGIYFQTIEGPQTIAIALLGIFVLGLLPHLKKNQWH